MWSRKVRNTGLDLLALPNDFTAMRASPDDIAGRRKSMRERSNNRRADAV